MRPETDRPGTKLSVILHILNKSNFFQKCCVKTAYITGGNEVDLAYILCITVLSAEGDLHILEHTQHCLLCCGAKAVIPLIVLNRNVS